MTIKPNQLQQRWARIQYIYQQSRGILPIEWIIENKKNILLKKIFFPLSRCHFIRHSVSYAIRYSRYTGTVFCVQFINWMTTMNANIFLFCNCHYMPACAFATIFSFQKFQNTKSMCFLFFLFLHYVAVGSSSFFLFTPFFLSFYPSNDNWEEQFNWNDTKCQICNSLYVCYVCDFVKFSAVVRFDCVYVVKRHLKHCESHTDLKKIQLLAAYVQFWALLIYNKWFSPFIPSHIPSFIAVITQIT